MKDFKPHWMYDPKTGEKHRARTPTDHNKMSKMGYTHEKPSKKETYSPQKHEWGTDASVKYAKQMTPGEQSEQTEKPMKTFSDIYEKVKSADKKPQKYKDDQGRERVRMVATDQDIVKESHFKVGQKVKCKASGMTGKVVKLDPEEKGKYYTVQRSDGKKMKYAPDELTAVTNEDTVTEGAKPYISMDADGHHVMTGSGKIHKSFPKDKVGYKAAQAHLNKNFDKLRKESLEEEENPVGGVRPKSKIKKYYKPRDKAGVKKGQGDTLAPKKKRSFSDMSPSEIDRLPKNKRALGHTNENYAYRDMSDTGGDEEVQMAVRQLHFIEYAAQEIMEYVEMRGDLDEWFQNKLANAHMKMQGLHSYIEGDKRAMGMGESTTYELNEKTYKANISDKDYQKIRSASMRGNFNHKFSRKTNGDVTFSTKNPRTLVKDLEKLVDSGASSWSEVLGIHEAVKKGPPAMSPQMKAKVAKKRAASGADKDLEKWKKQSADLKKHRAGSDTRMKVGTAAMKRKLNNETTDESVQSDNRAAKRLAKRAAERDAAGKSRALKPASLKLSPKAQQAMDRVRARNKAAEKGNYKESVEVSEGQRDDWAKIQKMDKGSPGSPQRLAYYKAQLAHRKKYGQDTKKLSDKIAKMNQRNVRSESVEGTRILSEPATSKAQQQAAGAALAAKRGDVDPSTLKGASKDMYDSMSKKELEDFASTKHKGLPTRKEESELGVLIPMEYDENNNLVPKQEGSALWDIRKKMENNED